MADIWGEPITAHGATATSTQLREAWRIWLGGKLVANRLSDALEHLGVPQVAHYESKHRGMRRRYSTSTVGTPACEIAGMMIQSARKANLIRFERGQWQFVRPAPSHEPRHD